MTIAVLGASGFVATRLTELWHRGPNSIRPIVRRYSGLARLSRFDLDCRVVDAKDEAALSEQLSGCEAVINCITGDASTILETAGASYRAANRAGVRRFIHLSSASVHGQNPAEGVDETSPLRDDQWHWYNNAKVQAERALRLELKRGATELVILRPGVVWGRRSRWISGFVEDLMSGQAWVLDGGSGVLNSVFVDNLIHAASLCLTAEGINGEAFFVQDGESVTWKDLYLPLCQAAGFDWADVANVPADTRLSATEPTSVERLKSLSVTRALAPRFAPRTKRVAKAALNAWKHPTQADPYALPTSAGPNVTEEFLQLQACRWRLSDEKARGRFGYRPVVSFAEGLADTISWLRWAGYPVEAPDLVRS